MNLCVVSPDCATFADQPLGTSHRGGSLSFCTLLKQVSRHSPSAPAKQPNKLPPIQQHRIELLKLWRSRYVGSRALGVIPPR